MKNISFKVKQFLSLVLSFILLMPSTLPAQNMDAAISIPEALKTNMTSTNISLSDAQSSFQKLVNAIQSKSPEAPRLLAEYKQKADIAAQSYFDYITQLRSFESYTEDISEIGVLKRLAKQYSEKQYKIPTIHNLKDNVIITHFRDKVAALTEENIFEITEIEIRELSDIHSNLLTKFENDILLDYSKLQTKVSDINTYATRMAREYLKPADVLLAAYSDLTAAQKIAFRANLKLREHPERLGSVIRDIRRYLRTTNPNNSPVFSFFRLLRELRGMNMVERENYVAYLTDLKSGHKQLLQDIGTLEGSTVRKLTVKKMMKIAPMLIIGTILVATTITEVNAQNKFSNQTMSHRNLKNISDNIKKGDVSLTEAMEYYSNPASESEIVKDIDHAFNFALLAEAKSAAENDIAIIEDIINNDPELQIDLTKQQNNKINQTILEDYDKTLNKTSLSL